MLQGAGKVGKYAAMLFCLALGIQTAFAAEGTALFQETFDKGVPKEWKEVKFEGRTEYSAVKEGTNTVLKAVAQSSATGMAAEVNIQPQKGQQLSWRWKIDKVPSGGSDDKKSSFDHTARLFVAFKTFIGPPRTINYVWANTANVGATFEHPSSGRSQWITLQSGNSKAGEWKTETRDIVADWKLLFGDDEPPQIVAIGLMTDSDGTGQTVTGFYDDIRLVAPVRK
ncbi:MAG: DUF3047 domain-containing protein [Verrucomicrobiales bacterium]